MPDADLGRFESPLVDLSSVLFAQGAALRDADVGVPSGGDVEGAKEARGTSVGGSDGTEPFFCLSKFSCDTTLTPSLFAAVDTCGALDAGAGGAVEADFSTCAEKVELVGGFLAAGAGTLVA